jgi:hypothetical protein
MKMSNRFLAVACTLCLLLNIAAAERSEKAPTPRDSFRFEPVSEKSLGLWEGERPVFVYNHGVIENPSMPNSRGRSSYFHPIYGLDEEILTDDFPKDHDYHRGLYWAWSHIKIGEQEYDSWSIRGIRTDFQKWLAKEVAPDKATLAAENGWFIGDKKVMTETVRIEAHAASPNSRAIDIELSWIPTDHPVTLAGAPEKSYGGFTFRFAPRSRTIITVPTGRTTDDLLMTKLPWADFSGDFTKDREDLSGAAIFVHPQHPNYPPTWMTRHYGLLAVGWPGVTPRTLPPAQPVTCRYRLWIHRGSPKVNEIQNAYDAYRVSDSSK